MVAARREADRCASEMTRRRSRVRTFSLCLFALATVSLGHSSTSAATASVSIAAAANLIFALDALSAEFTRVAPDVSVKTTSGASGSLFAQIKQGAPFDVFMSADTDYPRALVADGVADSAMLRTFATGRLVVWTTRNAFDISDLAALVRSQSVKRIAIAQPKSAPYGRAARAALETVGVWSNAEPKLVFGESIAQTAQFVETGNADIGFVAMSLVISPRLEKKGAWTEVPPALYRSVSLDHAAVLTTRGAANPAAKRFLEFLVSDSAKRILREFGYGVPTDETFPARLEPARAT
jgi:molybdate transport system substrate-binding protein